MDPKVEQLLQHFTNGVEFTKPEETTYGIEVETSFVQEGTQPETGPVPVTAQQTGQVFTALVGEGWETLKVNQGEPVKIRHPETMDILQLETGRQNFELATPPFMDPRALLKHAKNRLQGIYSAAKRYGAVPRFEPILETSENLLALPDERDRIWQEIDGVEALAPLATISSVQFTIGVSPETAIGALNGLRDNLGTLLEDYPQNEIWKQYIQQSKAGYESERYGCPARFASLEQYCSQLATLKKVSKNEAGTEATLQDWSKLDDIDLFLRSVWWYFRLRRYGSRLCIEVRPLPRRNDWKLDGQLEVVMKAMGLDTRAVWASRNKAVEADPSLRERHNTTCFTPPDCWDKGCLPDGRVRL